MKQLAWLACLAFGQLAHAQGESGVYIGAGLGTFDYDEGAGGVISDSTSTYKIVGGYRFNDHLAVELDIGRTGDLEGAFDQTFPGVGTVTLELNANYDVYAAKVLGYLPFDRWSLFGGLGYYSASLEAAVRAQGFGTVGFLDGHERGATVSAGVQYDFGLDLRNFSIRGEYQWFDFGSQIDVAGLSVGMLFRF